MMREKMSRPNASVPPQCSQDGGRQDAGEIDVERIVGRDALGEDAGEHHHDDDDEADRAERLLAAEIEDGAAPARQRGERREGCDRHQLYRMRGSNTA